VSLNPWWVSKRSQALQKDVHSLPVKYVVVVLFVLSESEGFSLGCANKNPETSELLA
jgi:hypothetical protein